MLLSAFRTSRTRSNDTRVPGGPPSTSTSSTLPFNFLTKPRSPFSTKTLDPEEPDLRDLNTALAALVEIFPDVRPDVFREMLSSLSDESRLHVVADQLLNHGAKWIQGRWRISSKIANSKILTEILEHEGGIEDETAELLPLSEQFRSQQYKSAVQAALEEEFVKLSRTAIEGVLAEQNFSYTHSRPVLAGLAAKSWKINFKAILKWKKPTDSHFLLIPARAPAAGALYLPQLKKTESPELDAELYQTVLGPILEKDRADKSAISQELAILLNHADAQENSATFDCECCYDDVAFESLAFCSTGEHVLCFKCIQNAVSAAMYAQAWSKTIDHQSGTVRCFSASSLQCSGCVPNHLTERALLQTRGGSKTWARFEEKLASNACKATNKKFHECPFCSYAELDDVYWPTGTLRFQKKSINDITGFFTMVLWALICIPLAWHYFVISLFVQITPIQTLIQVSLDKLARKHRLSTRFRCQRSDCARDSCRLCKKAWKDPHKCNEKEEISLRTSIEAAKSAASKRVCPKCNLSFVKESGCNKMTCTCGYTMCYLCRQGLGQSANKDNPHDDHDYSHFCGHFRAFPGQCVQCDKCDLYREGNQEEIIRRAGATAEKEWVAKQKKGSSYPEVRDTGYEAKVQAFVDHVVETFVTC